MEQGIEFNPVSFVIKQVGVAVVKDTDFMTNRGGFRCYVNEAGRDLPTNNDNALFVMQMEIPPNNPVSLNRMQIGSGGDSADRTQPGLPLKKGLAATMTHDYQALRATTLFAAMI